MAKVQKVSEEWDEKTIERIGEFVDPELEFPECPYAKYDDCDDLYVVCDHPKRDCVFCGSMNPSEENPEKDNYTKCPFDLHKEMYGDQ